MGKHKLLNGLPHNLVKSYFSTLNYEGGYMADWLARAAWQHTITVATLDIINGKLEPAALNAYPLMSSLKSLQVVLARHLQGHGLPPDFIREASIQVVFPSPLQNRLLYCYGVLVDVEGNRYESRRILEPAYPIRVSWLISQATALGRRIKRFLRFAQ